MQDKQLIEKYSVIIAEFMGSDTLKKFNNKQYYFAYHTDWNEIHRVWEKFKNIDHEKIPDDKLNKLTYTVNREIIKEAICDNNIFRAFSRMAETIEYLNTIKYHNDISTKQ